MAKNPPFWLPGVHARRRPFLLKRARIAAAVRDWLRRHGFLEGDTAALQVSPGNDTHLHAFATDLIGPGNGRSRLYLRTSPEFACKKLLAAGETRIFDFAKVFRNRQRGAMPPPQLTLLEWYRANEPYESVMQDCGSLLRIAAEAAGARTFTFRGRSVDPFAEPERITVAEAFDRFTGIDLLATVDADGGDPRYRAR